MCLCLFKVVELSHSYVEVAPIFLFEEIEILNHSKLLPTS